MGCQLNWWQHSAVLDQYKVIHWLFISKRSINVTNHRKIRKQDLIKVKGGKCCICGFSFYPEALEFHHVNPREKSYQLSSGSCRAWEKDLQEVKKCALVCSNCHKGIHAGILTVPINWDYIDQKAEQEITQRIEDNRTKKEKVRPPKKDTRKCIWPDRETLKEEIRTIPFLKIGEKYGVTDNAVRKWCKHYNLPSKTKEIKKYSNAEWLKI